MVVRVEQDASHAMLLIKLGEMLTNAEMFPREALSLLDAAAAVVEGIPHDATEGGEDARPRPVLVCAAGVGCNNIYVFKYT